MTKFVSKTLSTQEMTDIIENMEIYATNDLGTSYVHMGTHPLHGHITIVASLGDRHLMIQ